MKNDKDIVLVKLDPKIELREMWTADTSTVNVHNTIHQEDLFKAKSSGPGDTLGNEMPFVKINELTIHNIDTLTIDESGFIPRLTMVFTERSGEFTSVNYPKNDPIVSVYIKSQNPNVKAIRIDFLIESIRSNGDSDSDKEVEYILKGEMFIPKIYNNSSKAYRNMNSMDALIKIAEDLGLGFASNDFVTNDNMTWLNPNKNYIYTINEIVKHAYLNDDSFFVAHIDKYYHLTFINVAEQLSLDHNIQIGFTSMVNRDKISSVEMAKVKDNGDVLILSNVTELRGKQNFILDYHMMGDNGKILKKTGYQKKIFYYDHNLKEDDDKFVSFYMNSINIEGYQESDKIRLKPTNEHLQKTTVNKWMNINYGNTHSEWNSSILINNQNAKELNKVVLVTESEGINFNITKGSGIMVNIKHSSIKIKQRFSKSNLNVEINDVNTDELTSDIFVSGRFYIKGSIYNYDKYDPLKYRTTFLLTKFNWIDDVEVKK